MDPIATPRRQPLGLVNFRQGALAHRIDFEKILRHRPEDDRQLAAPTVRVLVHVFLPPEQVPTSREHGNDRLIGGEHIDPDQGRQARLRRKIAVVVHRRNQPQPVLAPRDVVFHPVARRGVHLPRARVVGDKARRNHPTEALQKRMLRQRPCQFRPRHGPRAGWVQHKAGLLPKGLHQGLRDHQGLLPPVLMGKAPQHIAETRTDHDPEIRRQGPGRGRPDHKRSPRFRH